VVRWDCGAKWAEGPAPQAQCATPLGLTLSEWLGRTEQKTSGPGLSVRRAGPLLEVTYQQQGSRPAQQAAPATQQLAANAPLEQPSAAVRAAHFMSKRFMSFSNRPGVDGVDILGLSIK
jgi:hypothetical protein